MDQEPHRFVCTIPVDGTFSRRDILKIGGLTVVAASALNPVLARGAVQPLIIMDQARGIVVADPATCIGCGRCERACTEFNSGRASPTLSRIKVERNTNFQADTEFTNRRGHGVYGSGLIVQNACQQCPHPVPCADVCPENAIVADPSTGARMVDTNRCTGCRVCLSACPWEMISFDPDSRKATKCDLCKGKPKCVEACPTGSLSYLPWRDLTGQTPPRISPKERPRGVKGNACFDCHLPGWKTEHASILGPQSVFGWIDRLGTIFVPAVVLGVIVHGVLRAIKKR